VSIHRPPVRWSRNSTGTTKGGHYLLVVWNHGAGWDDTDVYTPMASLATDSRVVRRPRADIGRLRARDALFRSTATTVADNYAIGFDDHAHDFLDNIELKRAIAAAHGAAGRKIDIIGMDACLMSMAEVAYQLRNDADYVIASEETVPLQGWPYAAARVKTIVEQDFVVHSAARGRSKPTGLTVGLPETPPPSQTFRLYKRLDFVRRTGWGDFLTSNLSL
jgi:Clostripain family